VITPERSTEEREAVLAALDEHLEVDTTLQAAEPLLALAAQYFADTRRGEGPVSTWHSAQTIADRLETDIPRTGKPLAEVARRLSRVLLDDVNRLAHPMYIGHQVSAPLPAAVWADAVISAFNQSQAVREMSPSFTPLERQVVAWMTDLIGWSERAGGTMTSGGSEATLTAMLAARAFRYPEVWEHGWSRVTGALPVLVCGDHTHYAVTRAAGILGLGMHQVRRVPSPAYHMDVDALEQLLASLRTEGTPVLAVVATAGCTATGAFDAFAEIATVCERYADAHGPLWLHVDAAHGGGALLSARERPRVDGMVRAQSVAWDPHKTLLLPLAAGLVLVRDAAVLDTAFAQHAPYLFGAHAEARAWDMGARSMQCSRRADVLKLYVALERYGADALGLLYERLCDVARALYDVLADTGVPFRALHTPESNILCFVWEPPSAPPSEWDALTDTLRERYNRSGRGWITVTTLDGRRVLRITVMNARTRVTHVEALVRGLTEEAAVVLKYAGYAAA
jgi:L-2,4-diaminobutyrate decarboxylase